MAQLTARGLTDLAEWRAALQALATNPDLPSDAPILCDLRPATTVPPTMNGRTFAEELMQLGPGRRVAFVARAAMASALERQFAASPATFQVFTDYTTALRWLIIHINSNGGQ
jgi:CheY-like chemotaxis protein